MKFLLKESFLLFRSLKESSIEKYETYILIFCKFSFHFHEVYMYQN